MATAEKQAAIADLAESFRGSSAAVLTEYRGLTVKQLSDLRGSLRGHATFAVVKNTLTKLAAREAGVEGIEDQLTGPTAVAFINGDPVEAAKGLRDFSRANPVLVIKGGVLDGKTMSAAEITRLADLESREVLLARLAGAMNASLSKAVYLFAAPLSQSARLIEALRAKREAEGPAAGDQRQDAVVPTPEESPQDSVVTTPEDSPQDTVVTTPEDSLQDSTQDSTQDSVQDSPAPAEEATPQDVATGGDAG